MKALIIDFSRGSEIKILNTRITSSVSIISGYFLKISPKDDAIGIAAAKLQEERLLDLPAFIIPRGDVVEKHVFHLPKMPDKEIKKVLPRQIAEVKDSSEDVVFNYLKNGMVTERQVEKVEIAAFFCGRDKMFDFLNRLKSEGIHPFKIIPEAQGLATLVEINPQLRSERMGTVLVDLMPTRLNLNIFKDKYWGLERYFLFRVEDIEHDEDLNDEDFSRISTELNRTFQYFKQRNRAYTIDQAILYGTSVNIDHLKNLINDNLPVTASEISLDYFRGKVSVPSHLKTAREFIYIFTLPIATAVAISNKNYLDLFPEEFKEKAKLPSRLAGLGISAAIIGTILVAGTVYFENIKNSYKEDLRKVNETYLSLSKNAAAIDKTKKQRANFYKHRSYIDFPVQYSYAAANLVRKISLIAPEEIELLEMEIDPSGQTLMFLLSGRIKAADNIAAQSRYIKFYQALKQFDEILHIESTNVNVNPGEDRGGMGTRRRGTGRDTAESRAAEIEKQVELYFTINGEVEPE